MSKLFYAMCLIIVGGIFNYASAADPENIALNKPALASSVESADFAAAKAFDGDLSTRWSSNFADNQWLSVDLQKPCMVSGVQLVWETAFGKEYKIQLSDDGKTWADVYVQNDGKGQTENITFEPKSAKYVRILGIKRGTEFGFSIFEFRVFGK